MKRCRFFLSAVKTVAFNEKMNQSLLASRSEESVAYLSLKIGYRGMTVFVRLKNNNILFILETRYKKDELKNVGDSNCQMSN